MEDICVSIVIPVYNAEKYLDESLGSVILQTWKNLEIICVDDGSEDASLEILKKYAAKDSRIKIYHQENQHAGVARNNGFKNATGKYVMFLDADDMFVSALIEKMVLQAEKTEAEIVICKGEGFDENEEHYNIDGSTLCMIYVPDKEVFSATDIPEDIFRLGAGWAWNKLYRSEFVRENNLRFLDTSISEDAYYTCLAIILASKISFVDKILIKHRMYSEKSLWDTRPLHWRDPIYMLRHLGEEMLRLKLFHCYERAYVNWVVQTLYDYMIGVSDYRYLKEFHDYCCSCLDKDFGLSSYYIDYFYEPYKYEALNESRDYTAEEWVVKVFSDAVKFKDQIIQKQKTYSEMLAKRKSWLIPDGAFPSESRLVIYGFGDVGRDYCRQINEEGKWKLAAVIDKNIVPEMVATVGKLASVNELPDIRFDYIIISIANKDIASEVKNVIKEQGVDSRKIFWFDPCGQASNI